MLRSMPKIVAGFAALSVFVGSADAETFKVYRKRPGFFESLFGSRNPPPRNDGFTNDDGNFVFKKARRQARRPAYDVFGNLINYKDKQYTNQDGNVEIIYGTDARKKSKPKVIKALATEYAEPEPLPGLGMGDLPYQPQLVAIVFDPKFATRQTDTPEQEAIRLTLADKTTKIRAVASERKALLAYYGATDFKPLWTKEGQVTERAMAILRVLASAEVEGLVASNYLPVGLSGFGNASQDLAGDNLKLAAFDVALSAKILKYARDLSGGQFAPAQLSLYNDIKPTPVDADGALRVLAHTPFIENYLISLAPQQPQYAIFKAALANLKDGGEVLDQVAGGPRVKVGSTDPRIPSIRAKLQTLGFLTADEAVNANEEMLDKPVAAALKKFQLANKVKQTGSLDEATVGAFNTDHTDDQRQRLIYNMERLRWLPKSMGSRYVFVNQPAFEVNVVEGGKSVWNSRVIVGRPLTQTYSFYDQIETVVFKPSWGVPASIIVNEYGPKSRKDPSYLDRNGFKVTDAEGNVVSSKSINWYTMGQTPTFGVQQPPGDDNALGELKFLFPNANSIYMHDTPNRNLFKESMRAFSHGCVRVQNPREFASVLLRWDEAKIAANIEESDSHSVSLEQKVPVYLTYFTAWPDADGKIMYYNDIYGRDVAMAKALAYNPSARTKSASDKIVESGDVIGGLNQN